MSSRSSTSRSASTRPEAPLRSPKPMAVFQSIHQVSLTQDRDEAALTDLALGAVVGGGGRREVAGRAGEVHGAAADAGARSTTRIGHRRGAALALGGILNRVCRLF